MPYLNSSIDPTSLGFLAILLGGSRAHCLQSFPEEVDRDWDGLGILQCSNIERLVVNDKLRASLCSLLHIVNEEAPGGSWTVITSYCLQFVSANYPQDLVDNDVEGGAWDVIRFSGRAADGSKRTIKLWSLDHILQALNDPAPHLIKVASFRNVPCCPRFHPRLGWTALVHQPRRAAGGLSILQDRDIFLLKDPSTATKSLRYAVLG